MLTRLHRDAGPPDASPNCAGGSAFQPIRNTPVGKAQSCASRSVVRHYRGGGAGFNSTDLTEATPRVVERFGARADSKGKYSERPSRTRSALGQKRKFTHLRPMSALPPKADIAKRCSNVRLVPKAGIPSLRLDVRLVTNAEIPRDAHTVAAGSAKKSPTHKKLKPLCVIYE